MFDNQAGKPSTHIGAEGPQVPPEAANAPTGSYVLARVVAEGTDPRMTVSVSLRSEPGGLRVVGIDRDWPGRTLVDPRTIERPARNRYVEFEPERQKLFDGYAQAWNAKSGENLSPDERFRALSPSEQTTFDGITHALMRASLTDEQGRPLGTALDLVTGVQRIAGQQMGRGGDEQFRLYVTLRPDARDTLDRSREFVRTRANTVYHAGYPLSYRLGMRNPSIQFSARRQRPERRHRYRLPHEQRSPGPLQRPPHFVEFGRAGRRQRTASRPALERVRGLVVGSVRRCRVRRKGKGGGGSDRHGSDESPNAPCHPIDRSIRPSPSWRTRSRSS